MDQELLRKTQLVQLEIAKEVKRICEKHDINYFLDAGTLLGAVRHQGFIPWDDDLDIGMLREDYNKFAEVAQKEMGDRYFFQSFDTEENFTLPFAKVRKNNTLYVEKPNIKSPMKNQGIYVDIFPYDPIPEDSSEWEKDNERLRNTDRLLMMKCRNYPWLALNGKAKVIKFLQYSPYKIISCFMKREKIRDKFRKQTELMMAYKGSLYGRSFGKVRYPQNYLTDYCKIKFEDELFQVPSAYDRVLKIHFGDYMTLPPEDKRGNRHSIVKVKL